MPTFNAVEEVLASFPWLSDLGDEIYQTLVNGILNNDPMDVVIQNVRSTNSYKTRFAGMATRQTSGLPAISEAEYLEVERGYLEQLRNFNQIGNLGLTSQEAFRDFAANQIGADVSVAEMNRRLDRATGLANNTPPEVQQAFQNFYGAPVSNDALVTYFLNPELGMSVIEDQMAAATIGGEALTRGLQITRTRAEILRREGVTADLARQGFANVAREQPVLTRLAQIQQVTPLNQQELEEFFFHEDPQVAARRNKTFTQALAQFQSGSPGQVSREGGLSELVDRNRSV